jgi:hypothetical protein
LAVEKPLSKAGARRKKIGSGKNVAVGKRPWDKDQGLSPPKERIFLSIDAINSTELKSSLAEPGSSLGIWAKYFANFLSEVAVVYREIFFAAIEKHCPNDCPYKTIHRTQKKSPHKVNVWKYIGDEVILTAVLTCPKHHASLHVLALAETIKYFNKYFEEQFKDNPKKMRFKGTAWVAGFPVKNIELDLLVSANDKDNTIKDFLGPSMDLGFRLSKFASDDRLIVSASLAYFIANEPPTKKPFKLWGKEDYFHLPLCFGGLAELKGIKGNKHPLIWYSIGETLESELSFVSNDGMLRYFEKSSFINKEIPPFIIGEGDVINHKYIEKYNKAVKEQKEIAGSPFFPMGKPHTNSKKGNIETTSGLDEDAIFKRLPHKPLK